jgi:membrane-bound serine protease (ClpP class)
MRNRRIVRLLIAAACMVGGLAGSARGQDEAPSSTVVRVPLAGVVDPFTADLVRGSIARAGEDGDAAVLLTIDTPGGLDSSMREIVQSILNAPIPVICYVSPEGARAASAGAYILESCPVAAMAPGTNVGAATPVGVSGAVLSQKVEQDSAAYMRSLAQRRGRNADLAERFVSEALSISAQEALDGNIIDLISPTQADLLATVNGRVVEVGGGTTVTLATAGATIQDQTLSPGAAFLHGLFDPNLAFIFFWLGLVLVIIEIIVPHLGVAGVLGALLLLTSFASFGMLPVQLIGIVLLIGSAVAFVLEVKAPGVGIATGIGVALLVAGALFLYNPSVPGVRVAPWVFVPVAALVAAFFLFAIQAAMRLRRRPPLQRPGAAVGSEGVVVGRDLAPEGVVRVASEEWQAIAAGGGTVPTGARIRVTEVNRLLLTVEPVGDDATTTPAGSAAPGARRRTK